jgi:hypothetical protein
MRTRLIALASLLVVLPQSLLAAEGDGFHTAPTLYWTSGAHRVDLGATLRLRTEAWDAFADDTDWFTGTRTRLRMQYGWAGKLLLAGEVQDVAPACPTTAAARCSTTATPTKPTATRRVTRCARCSRSCARRRRASCASVVRTSSSARRCSIPSRTGAT